MGQFFKSGQKVEKNGTVFKKTCQKIGKSGAVLKDIRPCNFEKVEKSGAVFIKNGKS